MKHLIISFLIVSSSWFSYAQTYIPFPTDSAIWRQNFLTYHPSGYFCLDFQEYINGDTAINGFTYHKIFITGSNGTNGGCNDVYFYDVNYYAIREDTSKQIFAYFYAGNYEFLLYDFNLGLGDTLADTLYGTQGPGGIVTAIDSVLVGTKYHKEYWISDQIGVATNYVALIEGLGSTYGLLADLTVNWSEKVNLLLCFMQNGQTVYPVGTSCTLVNVPELKKENRSVITPNPSNGNFIVWFPPDNHSISTITIFNSLGQLIKSINVSKSVAKVDINISGYPKGLYYIRAENSTINFNNKIILVRD
ncbi:MAG: T9SS type A sorting domain-containing protein [Bacteroidia bacterium]